MTPRRRQRLLPHRARVAGRRHGRRSTCRWTCAPCAPIPKVKADLGRVAMARGPLIYCAEEVDNGAGLNALIVPDDAGRGAKRRAVARTRRRRWRSSCRCGASAGPTAGRQALRRRAAPVLEETTGAPRALLPLGQPGARRDAGLGEGADDERARTPHGRRPPIELRGVRKSFGAVDVIHGLDLHDRRRRVRRLRRPVGLRQVHAAAHDRRAGGRDATATS